MNEMLGIKTPIEAIKSQDALAAAKATLERLDQFIIELRTTLENERKSGIPNIADQKAAIMAKISEKEKVQQEIESAKDRCRMRNREIDNWKSWLNSIAKIDKSEEIVKVDVEIKWRVSEISRQESLISSLEAKKMALMLDLMLSEMNLKAIEEGALNHPLDEDPRLLSLIAERDRVAEALKAETALIRSKITGCEGF